MNRQWTGHRNRLHWRMLAGSLLAASFSLCADETQSILFGVFPYLPPARLEQLYAPIAADLSEAVGRPVQLRTRPTYAQFRRELHNETYDLIYLQPFAYVETAAPHGYRSISRPTQALAALFVTQGNNGITRISDLNNRTVAAPPIKAAVSLLGRQTLREHNLIAGKNIRITYQNSHAACLRQVMIHKAAACITANSPLKVFQDKSGVNFHLLASSTPVPGTTYAVHERVPEQIRNSLQKHIGLWATTTRGRSLLNSIKNSGFVDSDDSDYDPVRKILARIQDTTK